MAKGRKGREVEGAKSRRVKGVRQIAAIRPASAEEIQRTLWERMVGVLEGRIDCAQAHAVAMVVEEQIHMLHARQQRPDVKKYKAQDGLKRWVN